MSNITKNLLIAAREALATLDGSGHAVVQKLRTAIDEASPLFEPRSTRDNEIIDMARTAWGSDDTEIDSDAEISEGDDNGAFVQAWVWVPFGGTCFDKERE